MHFEVLHGASTAGQIVVDGSSLDWLALLSRVIHILAAVTLAGGTFYQCAVLVPGVRIVQMGAASELDELLRGRWSKLVMASALFLIASGFYNYAITIQMASSGKITLPRSYHPLIGVKILVAFFIFFLASVLAGRSPAARRFQQHAPFWLAINSLAAVLVISLAGAAKMADRSLPGSARTTEPTIHQAAAQE
jgi:uncharacterized membrane protein